MNNIIKPIIALSFLVALWGCEENLDLAPISELSTENFYKSSSDFELAVNSVYSNLRSEYHEMYLFADIRSDNTYPFLSGSVTTQTDFDNFSILPTNGAIHSMWNNCYNGITRANSILDRIDDSDIDNTLKSRIKGEALFLRSLVYFNLVRIFGNVPLVTNEISPEESLEVPQSTPNEVYEQIITDLTLAKSLLPDSHGAVDIGRATSISANAILGKVYLTLGDFSKAEETLRLVLAREGAGVDLLENFEDVFSISNEYNPEIIFAIRWSDDGVNGNNFNYYFMNVNETGNKATTDLYDEFEEGDLRRDLTLNTNIAVNVIATSKYGYAPRGQGESDWPVVRYADVLLMLAEAMNEKAYAADGEALLLLNKVRNRAGLGGLSSSELPNQDSFRLAVEHERRMELACEGHRWFDLVRTGRYVEVMTAKGFNVKSYHNYYPIPEGEILKINDDKVLTQNAGY
ncbi:RagB/SusD family nutrient uptake outer membrane protein [Sunxiuqinia sp. A32]|uniref:RagB/SusD family nutrient uptake outer membrane protein n=1 Tax=Sunxiuqinia sp. A32 TaxID=3461496 RepID=UPI0040461515